MEDKKTSIRNRSKRPRRFTRSMRRKLSAVFIIVLVAVGVLLIRIMYINTHDGTDYAKQVLSQQSYDSQTIPYRRGEILDRNGIILAKSDRVYNVVLDCNAVNSSESYVEPTIRVLTEVFGLDEATVRDKITNPATEKSQYQVLKRKISEEEKEAFEDAVSTDEKLELSDAQKKERRSVQGIWFEELYSRDYPYDSLASNVVGFSNDEDAGIAGIESYYNSILNGTNGRTFGYLNQDSEYQKTTIEPEHGKNLVSTLDMNIQQIVEEKIADFDKTYSDEDSRGKGAANIGVVVMDPNTGEILGMATNSSYNLNDPQDMTSIYTGAELKKMDDEQYVAALNAMWSNFTVSTSFEPGSVVKPITVASALEMASVKDGQHFYCDGGEFITDTTIKCDNVNGHGDETLEYAIVNSCNDALMQIAASMGIDKFIDYEKLFGFGSTTGIDLPNETAGVTYNKNTMHEVELATCSFGQGFTVSMVQEIAAFASVINGGYYYQPHVIKQVLNADGSVEKTVNPLILKQPISTQVSEYLRTYLTTAVQKGTGQKSQVPGYLTGGKTGTAEKIDPETGRRASGKYLVSFIGAAPMDDPQVVIYVVVDEPNVEDQADSSYAQTLFREIATEVFPYMNLYPTENVTPEMLNILGLTQQDVIENQDVPDDTYQVTDGYGIIHYDASVTEDGRIVDGEGNVLPGVGLNSDGNIVDVYGNIIEVKQKETEAPIDPVAENPDVPAPPAEIDKTDSNDTTWSGITDEDLKKDTTDE